ncbi:TIGR03943 family protein [Tsukamurella sp. 8F]|uniref:TIGR03943 family putative permease subunit n=1 Tax=unclassified Tsukamurella TaxID=2633480 RepID=UPI0023B8BCE4|nr:MULTISPECIES: TIGR03943 family protein [unclassified Tsukamurella]MDF0528341.1 TIGR03943 family protein [Tsukamurella sp. 8J]MDF0586166.1 TIGR03943 family protein [Tsukamurella sp. 8F]
MSTRAQNLLLLLFGSAVLLAAGTGTYLNYVRPVMFWFLLASGLVICLLAVSGMAEDVRSMQVEDWNDPDPGDSPADHGHPHGHAHGATRVAWVLVVPVLLLLFAAPPPLGADAASTVSVASAEPADMRAFPPLPSGAAPAMSLFDFQDRAVSDSTGALDHRDVTLTGFVQRRGSQVLMGRLMIWCCVADARTILVSLQGDHVTARPGSWVTAVVRLVPGTATRNNMYTPTAKVASWREVPVPRNQYDY